MKCGHRVVAEKDLTGVHLAILVAGTHEDLWDNLVPSRLEEHVLALLVAEDWHGDMLEDGRKNPTLAQSSPPVEEDDNGEIRSQSDQNWVQNGSNVYQNWVRQRD